MLKEVLISSYFNYPRKAEFNSEANIVASSFSQELRELLYIAGDIEKFDLNLTNSLIGREIVVSGWLLRRQLTFNFDVYWKLSLNDKQNLLLQLLKDQLLEMAEKFQWETEPIKSAFNSLLKNGIRREAFWAYETSFEDDKVRVFYKMLHDSMDVFLNFFDREGGSSREILIARIWPNDDYLNMLLGTIQTRGNEIILESANKDFHISFAPHAASIKYVGNIPKWLNQA